MSRPRNPNSDRAIAELLTAATGLQVGISTVRRLRTKGVDTSDPDAVRHAFAMQERKPRPVSCGTKTTEQKPPRQPARPADGNQAAPRLVTDAEIKRRGAEISTGEALWQVRDFCEWLIDVSPDYLETMDVEEMKEWLQTECEKHVAHLLEIWP